MSEANPSPSSGESTGNCPIREHTGDGAYVGRCEFATYGGSCPRHGALEDYPTNDDREVHGADRRHPPVGMSGSLGILPGGFFARLLRGLRS